MAYKKITTDEDVKAALESRIYKYPQTGEPVDELLGHELNVIEMTKQDSEKLFLPSTGKTIRGKGLKFVKHEDLKNGYYWYLVK